jgi:hypothetical protein
MTRKNFYSSEISIIMAIVFWGVVAVTAASAYEFNFRQMDLGDGLYSGRILNLRNMESSNISYHQAERLLLKGFKGGRYDKEHGYNLFIHNSIRRGLS